MRLGWTASPLDRWLVLPTTNPSPEGSLFERPSGFEDSEGKRAIQGGSRTVFRRSDAMLVRLIMPGIQSAVACAVVKGIPSVRTETVVPKIANHDPHLLIRFDPEVTGVTTDQIVEALRSGKPSIELNPNTGQKPNQDIPADAN